MMVLTDLHGFIAITENPLIAPGPARLAMPFGSPCHSLHTPSGRSAFFSVRSTKLDWLWRMPLIL